jgi:hypothetical protein
MGRPGQPAELATADVMLADPRNDRNDRRAAAALSLAAVPLNTFDGYGLTAAYSGDLQDAALPRVSVTHRCCSAGSSECSASGTRLVLAATVGGPPVVSKLKWSLASLTPVSAAKLAF